MQGPCRDVAGTLQPWVVSLPPLRSLGHFPSREEQPHSWRGSPKRGKAGSLVDPAFCLCRPAPAVPHPVVREPSVPRGAAMARVLGAVLSGVDGVPVEVEVRISSQLPRVDVVGLPEAAVRESAARVRAAIAAAGHRFPERRVTVNLAPASRAQERRGTRPADRRRHPRCGGRDRRRATRRPGPRRRARPRRSRATRARRPRRWRSRCATTAARASSCRARTRRKPRSPRASRSSRPTICPPCSATSRPARASSREPLPELPDAAPADVPDLADVRGQAARQARTRDRRRGRPRTALRRAAGLRQDDARAASARVCCRRSTSRRRSR